MVNLLEQAAPFSNTIWSRLWANPSSRWGFYCLAPILLLAWLGPFISGHSYETLHLAYKNMPPSTTFWFGTDELGRDLFTRTWIGGRISLLIGLLAACIDLGVGLVWGSLAGFYGGRVDECLMRGADILYSIPYLLVATLFGVILGPGMFSIILAITLTGWITMARLVRGQILLLKEMDYVSAARALGASSPRILAYHILPNAKGPILITLTLTIPAAIFAEAFLSFLGLGIQAPVASWGTMTNEGLSALQFYPWRLFYPAFFMTLTLLGFQLISEGLKAIFDHQEDLHFYG